MDAKRKLSATDDIVKAHAWVTKHKSELPNIRRKEAIRLCQIDTGAHVTQTLMRKLENSVGVKRTMGGGCLNRTNGRNSEMKTIITELVWVMDQCKLEPSPGMMEVFRKYYPNKPSGK